MHPPFTSPSESRSSAQELADDLWNDITSEREVLLAENKDLKSRNFTLQNRVRTLEGEVERMKKREEGRERGGGGRGESSWNSGSRPIAGLPSRSTTHTSFPSSSSSSFFSFPPRSSYTKILPLPPPSDLDLFPNEILTEILRHLHQPFHFYHYSNALLGLADPPPESKPWNPVGLQLVCRRWRDIARPLFYRQVAFDGRDVVALTLARKLLSECRRHPIRSASISVWTDLTPGPLSRKLLSRVSLTIETTTHNHVSFAFIDDRSILRVCGTQCLSRTVQFKHWCSKLIDAILESLGRCWDDDSFEPWPSVTIHPNHLLALRLPLHDLSSLLSSISNKLGLISKLPRFQLDFPFDLPPSLLETVFPTLASILQHPSLPEGRDYIFEHTGNTKKIIFGTHSEKDASVFRGKIEELGELEVVVEVVVLEL